MLNIFGYGLSGLPLISDAETRSISAENPDGSKGGGAKATPDPTGPARILGKGWKARPCITLPRESTTRIAEIDGSGVIQHIWITVDAKAYRNCLIRFYWDDEDNASVEVPLGDFFANGHGLRYNVNSLPVCVNPAGGFNCYWPMPFRSKAIVEIQNDSPEDIPGFFYQISYSMLNIPRDAAYFHAQWRRSTTQRENPVHTIVDNIKGTGHYVGTFLAWTQLSNGWWGEGEIKFYIDGDIDYPTICGTGTEDYVGGAWCFADQTYSTPFLGYPLRRVNPAEVPRHALYRWHVLDPIRFKEDLSVTIQSLGAWPNMTYQPLSDDIASVAYWYQKEPHSVFPSTPEIMSRWSR